MQYLKMYLKNIADTGNIQFADSILKTASDVGENFLKKFSFTRHETGLLFGNVQSGKTGHMFGIICKAADLGFSAFVILTTDNVVLQQQTLDRVRSDLKGFCVCSENDAQLFTENRLMLPSIIILKKNARVLKQWANILSSTGFLKGNPLFIIDDEADAASLNNLINKDRESAISSYLNIIKSEASSSLYLQVTGTPQAIFLQTTTSGWRPSFIYYFSPGPRYLGGDFFFPSLERPRCVSFINGMKNPLREAVIRHLAVTAQIFSAGGIVCNCLLHPGVRISSHEKLAADLIKELTWCINNINGDYKLALQEQYEALVPSNSTKASFSIIFDRTRRLLEDKAINLLIMNGKSNIQSCEYSKGCNFIIGGNTLGRGVTFPSLQTIYYTRISRNPQADTMWQHSRMFGYDRDPGLMMVYIDAILYKLFADINSTNNSIIAQIEQGFENVNIYYPKPLAPTRKTVLDKRHLYIISGGTNYYPANPDNDTIDEISMLLDPFSDSEPYYQVSLKLIKEILKHILPSPDFKMEAIQQAIDALLAEHPRTQAILIVRRNRLVTQGTGALLSPNDWSLGNSFTNKTVLTIYQIDGLKGWKRKNLWIPNIKLPQETVYYNIIK